MAKPYKPAEQQSGKVKIRVIEFEVEGSDATMQESLKSITAALNRGMTAAPPPPRAVRFVQPPSHQVDGEGQMDPGDAQDVEAVEDVSEPATPRRPTAQRRLPAPKLLDINFNAAAPTLKAFAAEKQPDGYSDPS